MTHGLTNAQFIELATSFLGPFYIALALMNAIAALWLWRSGKVKTWFKLPGIKSGMTNVAVWLLFAVFFTLLAALAMGGVWAPSLSESIRETINKYTVPVFFSAGTTIGLIVLYFCRGFFVRPAVAWTIWNLMWLFLGLSMTDREFYEIVAKPDNVPIAGMVFLLAFFTWLATYKAVENDNRLARGEPPLEKLDNEKVLVWPDLVYTELICMIALTAFLIFWAIALPAPLEEAANTAKTPLSSKAPWYFLGLQDMLVYFDPWMAGVVLPSVIVGGLMAIPYLDFNKKGNGYYTIKERTFSYSVFQFGFLGLWIPLIVLGTFLRGPFWNFYGPYEVWDPHKIESSVNIFLSDMFWKDLLSMEVPKAAADSGFLVQIGTILVREAPGILLVLGYFIVLPPIMALTVMRGFYKRMGFIRFMVLTNLLLFMASLPIKMVLRWVFNLKYLITIPEYFLNF